MLMVTSTRPRESLDEMRFLIDGSSEASSDPTRRCISRNRLLTVLRSTETEKSSPATIALPYPVIDFMFFYPRITQVKSVLTAQSVDPLPRPRIATHKAFDIARPLQAIPRVFRSR